MTRLTLEDVVDIPSNRDYLFDEYLQEEQAEWEYKARPENLLKVLDQWTTPMCTMFAKQHIVNAHNILEDIMQEWRIIREQKNANDYWIDTIRHLQTRIDNARKAGEIAGYLSIPRVWLKTPTGIMTKERRIEEINKALSKWYFIYTWSEYVKRTMNMKPLLNFTTKQTGHAFSLTGIENGNIKFINSWWEKWGDKWYWYIKQDDVDKLFTCYICIPADNSEWFKKFRANKKVMELIALAKWLYEEARKENNKAKLTYFEAIQLSKTLTNLYKL